MDKGLVLGNGEGVVDLPKATSTRVAKWERMLLLWSCTIPCFFHNLGLSCRSLQRFPLTQTRKFPTSLAQAQLFLL